MSDISMKISNIFQNIRHISPLLSRNLWLTCVAMVCCNRLSAQEFVNLNASDYAIDSYYTAQFSQVDDVILEYPEYVALSQAEIKEVKQKNVEIGSEPRIYKEWNTFRRERMLDVSIHPFFQRDGKFYRLTSIKLTPIIYNKERSQVSRQEVSSSRYAEHSKLASGKWVKIHVDDEGIYQLTPSLIESMGFSNLSKIHVYGYGGRNLPEQMNYTGVNAQYDDLTEVPVLRENDRLLFFAEGTVRWTWDDNNKKWLHQQNPYALHSYYFVTEEETPCLEVQTTEVTTNATDTLTHVIHHALYERDAFSWFQGGREFHDSYDFANGNTHTFNLKAPSLLENALGQIDINFSSSHVSLINSVKVELNDNALTNINIGTIGDYESAKARLSSSKNISISSENSFKFTSTSGIPARLDFIRMSYPMQLSAAASPVSFELYYNKDPKATTSIPQLCLKGAVSIDMADENTKVWRLGTALTAVTEMKGYLSGNKYVVNLSNNTNGMRYVILNTRNTYPVPTIDGSVENQDLHGDATIYNMVIITPSSGKFDEAAQALADLHVKNDGMRVKIVRANQIYNEFSSGTPNATAYRKYLKMIYDRQTSSQLLNDGLDYLVLFGPSVWDNRGVTFNDFNADNYILCYENNSTANSTSISMGALQSYVTDDFFGFLDDGEGSNMIREKIDIAVGRFPVNTPEEAMIMVEKSAQHHLNKYVGAWKNKVCVIADEGDNNLHMNDTEAVVKAINNVMGENLYVHKIYPDAYVRTTSATGNTYPAVTKLICDEMQKGALFFNYAGHGSEHRLSHSSILYDYNFSENITDNLTLWVFASCEITPFDQQVEDMGRIALTNPKGGAYSVMCSTRAVYASYNNALNVAFARHLFEQDDEGNYPSIGKALMQSKVDMVNPPTSTSSTDYTVNKMKYALLGDPAVSLMTPIQGIIIDSINGIEPKATSPIQLKAGSKVSVVGHVADASRFNRGVVSLTAFDREEKVTCLNNDGTAKTPKQFTTRKSIIFEGSDSIVNGKFRISLIVPRTISYSKDHGKMLFYAVNEDHSLECQGYNTDFYLKGTDDDATTDTIGPNVRIYLNTVDFVSNGKVNSTPVFGAFVSDSTGIEVTGNGVGHDIQLTIDNDPSKVYVLNSYFNYDFGSYKSGSLTFEIPELSKGRHTLSFKVWDILDNSTNAGLSFVVTDEQDVKRFSVSATQNPAKSHTQFVVSNIDKTDNAPLVLEIYNTLGEMVWRKEKATSGTFETIPWNLNTSDGASLNTGIYFFRARKGNETSSTEKIIIVRQ